jgi:NAD(P)-dependent dehydrogenase (short-subunit alcohol dehydrogenase family)
MGLERLDTVAIITGAASGIGAACARDVAKRAEGGLILVDQDVDALDRLADALGEQGAAPERVSMLAFDVGDADDWARAGQFIRDQYGRLDWAVVNAAAAPASTGAPTDLIDWRRSMATNLDGAFMSLRTVMPLMKLNSQGGAVVITAPAAAIKSDPASALKAGLLQLVRAAAKEGAPDLLRINALAHSGAEAPVAASLPLFQDLVGQAGGEQAALEAIAKLAMPAARYAETDVARAILMLLSDATPISGATLVVDGGYTL